MWNGSYEQQAVPDLTNRYYPIGTVNVPVLFSSEYLLIDTTSINSPPNWTHAGYLRQAFEAPVIGAASAANFSSHKVYLNRLSIIQLPPLSPNYTILIDVPFRILDISFTVFQYEQD